MNVPLPPPSAEPMLYFLSNSLAVVAAAAVVFFILGLWFGALTWGRYKRRARAFQEETSLLRHEIATLKRRIAEEAVEPSRPVSIIDEGPSVELQPMLFQFTPPAPEPEATPLPAPAEVKPAASVQPPPASITTIIAKSKSSVAVPAPVPDSIGRDAVSNTPAVPPAPAPPVAAERLTAPPPVEVAAAPLVPLPLSLKASAAPESPPALPLPEDGPVVSLVQPGSVTAMPFPPLLPAATSGDASVTTQMSASFQASHDAGLPEFPALPGLDSGAVTLSSSSAPEPAAPVPMPVPVVPVSMTVPAAPPPPALEAVAAPAPAPAAPQPTPAAMPPVPEAPPTNWFARELDAGLGKVDPLVGFCYQQRPERWDDLTLLRGLGEGIQERLHAIGIFTFKQIGLWTEAQSLETGTRIQARERLQRERWVQQAKDLHFLKYGERLVA